MILQSAVIIDNSIPAPNMFTLKYTLLYSTVLGWAYYRHNEPTKVKDVERNSSDQYGM